MRKTVPIIWAWLVFCQNSGSPIARPSATSELKCAFLCVARAVPISSKVCHVGTVSGCTSGWDGKEYHGHHRQSTVT